ncbi:hypothetical protein [Caenimonas sp. SL110]|uniref:hypothetical protein n=1 Tax=Caenimonas sp. SL110 TaxID=1450524 RepID=UPI0006537B75|nr:hypothetical protein [Caenimonas sp. SL110]
MTAPQTIERIERLIWILIYAGLIMAITGVAVRQASPAGAWTLIAVGTVLVVTGVVLIWVRSRMDESKIPDNKTQGTPDK